MRHQRSRGVLGAAMFSTVAEDAGRQDDARTVRDFSNSMISGGFSFGGLIIGHGVSDRDWVLAAGIAAAVVAGLVAKFVLRVPLIGTPPRSRRLRRGRPALTAPADRARRMLRLEVLDQ